MVDDTLLYDVNGNVTRHSGKKATFNYDPFNQLILAQAQGSLGIDSVRYGYNAAGERIYKAYSYRYRARCNQQNLRDGLEEEEEGPGGDDTTSLFCTFTAVRYTYYVLGLGKVLAEQSSPSPSSATAKFIYAGNSRIGMREASGLLHYYLNDHLGSTRVVVDSTGLVKDFHHYSSFGGTLYEQTATNQAYRYTSKPLDKEGGLNLYYYGARYYDPELGRFYAIDPAAGSYPSLSPYAYCANNPLRNVDPDGGLIWDIVDVGFAAWSIKDLYDEPSWGNAGWATLDVAAVLPFAPSSGWFRRGADAASGAGRALGIGAKTTKVGYSSFRAFKRAMGSAGDGMVWHHIVEQCKVGQFAAEAVHNTSNIIKLPTAIHYRVNAIYSSIRLYTEGKTVREWLKGKSWKQQMEHGMNAIEEAYQSLSQEEKRQQRFQELMDGLRSSVWDASN